MLMLVLVKKSFSFKKIKNHFRSQLLGLSVNVVSLIFLFIPWDFIPLFDIFKIVFSLTRLPVAPVHTVNKNLFE